MSKKISVLIGTGSIAREHLAVLASIEDVEVAAVCDISAARAEATAERFRIKKWFTNYRDMLNSTSPDFVHITTPPKSHFELTKACLEMGLNVICEKPITSTYEEFRILRGLATEKAVLLIENQNYRFHSSVHSIDQYVETGKLGKIVEVQIQVYLDIHSSDSIYRDPNMSHYTAQMKGGVVGDFLTHISYLAEHYSGRTIGVSSTCCTLGGSIGSLADELRALLISKDSLAYIGFSGNAQPNGFWLRVIGTKGQVEANLFEPPRISYRKLRGKTGPVATLTDGLCEARDIFKSTCGGLWRKLAGTGRYDGLEESIRKSYLALNSNVPPPLSLDQIDDTSKLIQMLTADEQRK